MYSFGKTIQIDGKQNAADRVFIKELWDGCAKGLAEFYAALMFKFGLIHTSMT